MPVDVLPSTAVVTRIGYGPRERVTVHGLAGEPFEIPLARLAEFVTERGNPDERKAGGGGRRGTSLPRAVRGSPVRRHAGAGQRLRPQHAGVERLDASRRGGPRRRQRQPPPFRRRPAASQRRVPAYSRGGHPADEGGPGVRGRARLGDRIHPESGDLPDGKGVEGSPRLQSSRLRGDARGSGGVPAGTDRGAAGGGVRRDRASQGPCAGRRVPGIPASGGTRGGGGRCRPVRPRRGAGARAARLRLRKGGDPASLQPPPGRGPDRGGRAVSRLPRRSDGTGDRESPGGDGGMEGAPRDG